MTRTVEMPPVDRLRRRSGGKIVAGVCGGIADHLGVDVFRVRVVFVALAALAGAGVAAYALLWFCLLYTISEPT
ncbi:MAG: PspC domain-containing protein, partial [Gordonia sp. (in: high G+C Gram-positive bacteria)]|uniref:PspC domain-containing protein n=1 Tax=Gordonia sp. (in: high G+C Gram-positive bacteria) TaxID=84139 RepID=UPI003C737AC7